MFFSSSRSFPAAAAAVDLVGDYDGAADLNTFSVNESLPLGGPVTEYNQYTRISVVEQNNSFVRGVEYRSENGIDWTVYCNFFGIISQKSKQQQIYAVKLQQFINSDNSSEVLLTQMLLGTRVGYYDSSVEKMYIDYTGQSPSLLQLGGESYTASKASSDPLSKTDVSADVALDLTGTYDGAATYYKFGINESQDMGSDVVYFDQLNRLDLVEQRGSFVRGAEYWSDDNGDTWFLVCYIFGEIVQKSNQPSVYSVRLQEYFNAANTSAARYQAETLGLLAGYYDTATQDMHLDYTGQTLSLQLCGAQSFVATKSRCVANNLCRPDACIHLLYVYGVCFNQRRARL
jgi:hypothetical protein